MTHSSTWLPLAPGLVDGVEGLLESVRLFQGRLVFHPAVKVQALFIAQCALALQEHEAIVHQSALLFQRQFGPQFIVGLLQCVVRHPDEVELVDDDGGVRQYRTHRIAVGCPHIHRHVLHRVPVRHLEQVLRHRVFVPVVEHVHDAVVLDVRDDASRLVDDVDFADAHPLRRLEVDGLLKLVDVVAEDVVDRSLDHAGFVGQRGEDALRRLLPDPLHQPVGHHPVLGQHGPRLRECLAAGLAA